MGKISDYTRVLAAKLADVFVVDQTDNGTTETKSATVEQIGTAIGTLQNFADLDTSNKNLVDAINEIASYTPVYGNTASGAIATFDTSLALPLQDCTIEINAVQESGTPTPSSPKAISGFTGANIHVADNETPHIIDNVTPITWQASAGTVYGGSLDVTSGVLTVTCVGVLIDGVTVKATSGDLYSGRLRASIPYPSGKTVHYEGASTYCLCDKIKPNYNATIGSQVGSDILSIFPHSSGIFIKFSDDCNVSDVASANAWLSNNNVFIVYELSTPVTYQLTPTQISAIVGTNNIFTDTNGDTSVMYACSLKDYIDSQ